MDIYPGCRDALEVFFCAQQAVTQESGQRSHCSSYRRPYEANSGRCLAFCPAIGDACPAAALAYCESRCRAVAYPGASFCDVLEIDGLLPSAWDEDTLDINNLYRIEAAQGTPILRDQRPYYRSIPSRRPAGSARATKLDYYLYATRRRGFTEWVFDTDEFDFNGAQAYVSDATLAPYHINSEWTVWSTRRQEWTTGRINIRCLDVSTASPAPASTRWGGGGAAVSLGSALVAVAAWRAAARRRPRAAPM